MCPAPQSNGPVLRGGRCGLRMTTPQVIKGSAHAARSLLKQVLQLDFPGCTVSQFAAPRSASPPNCQQAAAPPASVGRRRRPRAQIHDGSRMPDGTSKRAASQNASESFPPRTKSHRAGNLRGDQGNATNGETTCDNERAAGESQSSAACSRPSPTISGTGPGPLLRRAFRSAPATPGACIGPSNQSKYAEDIPRLSAVVCSWTAGYASKHSLEMQRGTLLGWLWATHIPRLRRSFNQSLPTVRRKWDEGIGIMHLERTPSSSRLLSSPSCQSDFGPPPPSGNLEPESSLPCPSRIPRGLRANISTRAAVITRFFVSLITHFLSLHAPFPSEVDDDNHILLGRFCLDIPQRPPAVVLYASFLSRRETKPCHP